MTFYHISSPSLPTTEFKKETVCINILYTCIYIYISKYWYISWHAWFYYYYFLFFLLLASIIIQHTHMEIIYCVKIRSRWACVRCERTMTVTKPKRGKNQNVIVIKETNIIINNKRNTNTVDFNNRIRRVKCFVKIGTYSSALLQASGVKNRPTEKLNHCHH